MTWKVKLHEYYILSGKLINWIVLNNLQLIRFHENTNKNKMDIGKHDDVILFMMKRIWSITCSQMTPMRYGLLCPNMD